MDNNSINAVRKNKMIPYRDIYINTTKKAFKKRNAEGTLQIPYYGNIYYGVAPYSEDTRDAVYECSCDITEIEKFVKVEKPKNRGWLVTYIFPDRDTDFPTVRGRLTKEDANQLMVEAMKFWESAGYKVTGSISDTLYVIDEFKVKCVISLREDKGL